MPFSLDASHGIGQFNFGGELRHCRTESPILDGRLLEEYEVASDDANCGEPHEDPETSF